MQCVRVYDGGREHERRQERREVHGRSERRKRTVLPQCPALRREHGTVFAAGYVQGQPVCAVDAEPVCVLQQQPDQLYRPDGA